ncbi:hypothetical protein R1A27_20315 [Methylobacterium sp. NMS12]|uniref:hypothetical protein n=1 Tax=Methylobacterium sp. NMS12 TaxID=3079766 RepID=UPI003F8825B1
MKRSAVIFRVLPAKTGFVFTRTQSHQVAPSGAAVVDRFGPYATQRAAHELAQRAAARLRAEDPDCVVGVVDIDPRPDPASLSARRRQEAIDERRIEARRKRQRERYARSIATPEGRARISERARANYARRVETPEARERLNERARKWPAGGSGIIVCSDPGDGSAPTCGECGKPTGYRFGRPLRFCPRAASEKRSSCLVRHQNKRRGELLQSDPGLRLRANQRQREYALRFPEKRRQKLLKDQQRRRKNPKQYAAKLEAERQRKARVRAAERAQRQSTELPTGSVLLTASARAPGRDLLARIYGAVPSHLPPSLRSEIISETALLVLEGAELPAAVAQASKSVRKNASQLRYTKPIEDCFWLADETFAEMEASL